MRYTPVCFLCPIPFRLRAYRRSVVTGRCLLIWALSLTGLTYFQCSLHQAMDWPYFSFTNAHTKGWPNFIVTFTGKRADHNLAWLTRMWRPDLSVTCTDIQTRPHFNIKGRPGFIVTQVDRLTWFQRALSQREDLFQRDLICFRVDLISTWLKSKGLPDVSVA